MAVRTDTHAHLVWPIFLLAAAGLLLLSLSPVTAEAQRIGRHGNQPTIVLVHGAWADPSGWQQVIDRLHKDGFQTVTPKLDLLSLDGDTAIVRAALDAITGDKILVGHSYGGEVVSAASAGRSDIRAIVYTAAFVPDQGETGLDLLAGYAPSAALDHLIFTGEPWNSPAYLDSAFFHEVFAADLSDSDAAAMNAAQQPTHPATFASPSGPVGWHDLPVYYAVSGQDLIIDPNLQGWMAARAGATTIEFKKASHVGGFTVHAHQFTKLIERAVRETGC
ncbi:MAG TPA: alpha/beta hydrolase [Thermomicrobiales bacterium]|nr:alpha/beta hydrolase [Thermomicrobiales bacterium]